MTTEWKQDRPTGTQVEVPGEEGPSPHRRGGRRRWWIVFWVVVGLLVLAHLGGGWYLSGRIYSSALASTPATGTPAYDDVKVSALGGGRVTLQRLPDAAENFDAPGRYGLAWQGGTGVVGPATRNADGTVTRPFGLVSGRAPTVGQSAAVDRAVWFTPEAATGRTPTSVDIAGMPAWLFGSRAGASTGATVIFVHGQNGTRLDGLRLTRTAMARNAVLDITYRNDVGAPKDPSGRLGYGATEWRDLDSAVQWALGHGATSVVLAGQSMGGAVVAAFMENSPRRSEVTGLILDAPALSLADMVTYGARDMLPGSRAVPASVLWFGERFASARFGVDWQAIDYVRDSSWVRVPTLVLHGTADPSVPVELSRRLHAARPDRVRLEEFPGALHAESWNFDSARYDALVSAFLRRVG
ncbi:alpha/beta hydrolase family protein [Pedococcus sp. NPDC057267]|uniref:alpha/beta hydrolase family protein n=1 Tax=Pedococcus sp. NPDC057267 TaxID=3346077 RepID=UPI00362706D9